MYLAFRDAYPWLSNREIADRLGVNEASVRRGLKSARPITVVRPVRTILRELADALDPER